MKAIAAPLLILVLSTLSAAAQSSGEVRLPPVTGEAENPPVIQYITYTAFITNGSESGFTIDFHFIAPKGNAVRFQQKLVERIGFGMAFPTKPITIPADAQKSGADFITHGHCGYMGNGILKLDASITDADGNYGNIVRHTISCRGGSLPYVTQQVQISGKETTVAIPYTGTEEALRSFIESWEKGEPPYELMTPNAAASTQTQSAAIKKQIDDWGKLKSIAFKIVNDHDLDVYSVEFEHGESIWWVPQLTSDGKLLALGFGPSKADTMSAAAHNEQSSPVPAQ